jgi:hypothetical protein
MPISSPFSTNRRALGTPRYPKNKREEKRKIMTTKTCPVSVDKCNNRGHYHSNVQKFNTKRKIKVYSTHEVNYHHPQTIPVKSNTLDTGKNIIRSTYKHNVHHYNTNIMCITLSRSIIKFLISTTKPTQYFFYLHFYFISWDRFNRLTFVLLYGNYIENSLPSTKIEKLVRPKPAQCQSRSRQMQ